MLIMKYTKTGTAAYLPHLDLLRDFQRIFRRAQIEIVFSEGFHPHMLLYFAPPLAVGTQSVAEYCTVGCTLAPEEFAARFNSGSTADIRCLSCAEIGQNPNLAARLCWGEYRLEFENSDRLESVLTRISACDSLLIDYPVKGEMKQREVRSAIRSLEVRDGAAVAVLAQGNVTLRADRLADHIGKEMGCECVRVTRLRQLTEDGRDADLLFEGGNR